MTNGVQRRYESTVTAEIRIVLQGALSQGFFRLAVRPVAVPLAVVDGDLVEQVQRFGNVTTAAGRGRARRPNGGGGDQFVVRAHPAVRGGKTSLKANR